MPFLRFLARWSLAYAVLMAAALVIAHGWSVLNSLGTAEGLVWMGVPVVLMLLVLAVLALVRAAGAGKGGAMVVQFLPYPLVAIPVLLWLFFWWGTLGVWSAVVHGLFAAAIHLAEFRPGVLAEAKARR
ncbi:hypothetical protein Afil01_43590 [Actinorhabdospora filicis]|uniref:Uncharacterized protein n=1 Tax=Actinorhabdospora filicis TaxID=1785913 RepID=A0A9W6W4R2_9ACTN|nr:hypothetical protein [Actinorhabdospora filicis]GLZ79552.1 hypothetical protein Afil01_43590 [Actinorhabdospora filicis]